MAAQIGMGLAIGCKISTCE